MDAIAKNNRDVDSNPRGVLGSCVDAGLCGWLGLISRRCCNCGQAHGGAGCQMSHPDPLARCWSAEGRAGVGFVPHAIQPGPPRKHPLPPRCRWDDDRCCIAGVGSGAGWGGGGGGRLEDGSGVGRRVGGRRGRAVFALRRVFAHSGGVAQLKHAACDTDFPSSRRTTPAWLRAAALLRWALARAWSFSRRSTRISPRSPHGAGGQVPFDAPSARWGTPITPSSAKCCKKLQRKVPYERFQSHKQSP